MVVLFRNINDLIKAFRMYSVKYPGGASSICKETGALKPQMNATR